MWKLLQDAMCTKCHNYDGREGLAKKS